MADRVTVVLPWGSLLGAVARPDVRLLGHIRALCQPHARLTVVFSVGERDQAEARRLALPAFEPGHLHGDLPGGYAASGFHVMQARALALDDLSRWPSTWARRLAHGERRPVFQIDACAIGR
jgi:hypothetical protein